MKRYFRSQTTNLLPGGGKVKFSISGNYFRLLACALPLKITFGGVNADEMTIYQGLGLPFGDEIYNEVWLEPAIDITTPLKVEFFYGFGEVHDTRAVRDIAATISREDAERINLGTVASFEVPTKIIGVPLAGGVINGLQTITLSGTPPAGYWRRKCVLISNDDPANKLVIVDDAGTDCLRVYPFTSVRLDIGGPVKVKNPNGTAVAANVSEIWIQV